MLLQIKTGQYSIQPPPRLGKQWVDILGIIDTQHTSHIATISSNKLLGCCCLTHLLCICSCSAELDTYWLSCVLSCHGPWQRALGFIYHCRRRLKIPTYELLIVFHECFCRAVHYVYLRCIFILRYGAQCAIDGNVVSKVQKVQRWMKRCGGNPSINVLGRFESSSNNLRHGTVLQSGSNLGAKFYVDIKKYFDSWCNDNLAVGASARWTQTSHLIKCLSRVFWKVPILNTFENGQNDQLVVQFGEYIFGYIFYSFPGFPESWSAIIYTFNLCIHLLSFYHVLKKVKNIFYLFTTHN